MVEAGKDRLGRNPLSVTADMVPAGALVFTLMWPITARIYTWSRGAVMTLAGIRYHPLKLGSQIIHPHLNKTVKAHVHRLDKQYVLVLPAFISIGQNWRL